MCLEVFLWFLCPVCTLMCVVVVELVKLFTPQSKNFISFCTFIKTEHMQVNSPIHMDNWIVFNRIFNICANMIYSKTFFKTPRQFCNGRLWLLCLSDKHVFSGQPADPAFKRVSGLQHVAKVCSSAALLLWLLNKLLPNGPNMPNRSETSTFTISDNNY